MDHVGIPEMRYASIDIGTNTVLLLVADTKGDRIIPVREEQRVPRLGKGVSGNGLLSEESFQRVIEVLKEYRAILEMEFPELNLSDAAVTATSAARDAANREAFVKGILEETGFHVKILSGIEEADYTFRGALSVLDEPWESEPVVVLDIGGGSTEIACGVDYELQDVHSFQMGSVRFTERYLPGDPPDETHMQLCTRSVERMFKSRPFNFPGECHAVGVAGTVTSLAYMEKQLDHYDPAMLNGFRLNLNNIEKWIKRLSDMTTRQMIDAWPEIMSGRADIFIAGLLILKGFMGTYNLHDIIVSTGGIRYGAVLNNREL